MGERKLFLPGAVPRIGKTNGGKYKIYAIGPVSVGGLNYWAEIGGGAWTKDPPIKLDSQKRNGYDHPIEAIKAARAIFPSRADYDEFLSFPIGSESKTLTKKSPPPTFDEDDAELWP